MILPEPLEFEWDSGNQDKNLVSHSVFAKEIEEAFFDDSKKIFKDVLHSNDEERFLLIGKTGSERLLFIVFTLRKKKTRVVSARDLNKKEYKLYEKRT